jgi:SAM-dependent methyltransferase
MQSFFVPCHVCGSFELESLFPSTYRDASTTLQSIGICSNCGLVYRNPLIPELCAPQYSKPSDWDALRPPAAFRERFTYLTSEIASRVSVGKGQLFLDVGAGPGWLAAHLEKAFPDAIPVLLEPAAPVAVDTKTRHPSAVVLPGVLAESSLPRGSFSLIMVCGVDYLFHNHRNDIQLLEGLLRDDGVLYIERNVFIEQASYFRSPILDMDDMCGSNPQMNTWFSRPQFREYLEEFFDVFDTIEYVMGDPPAPYVNHINQMSGFFCRKRTGDHRISKPNARYSEVVQVLRQRTVDSSLEDLRMLRESGVRTVIICGRGDEAHALAKLSREYDLFSIAGFVEPGKPAPTRDVLAEEFATADGSAKLDAFLLASVTEQDQYIAALRQLGHGNIALPCFRPGLRTFRSDGASKIQLKAFLPSLLRRSGLTALPSDWGIASAPR